MQTYGVEHQRSLLPALIRQIVAMSRRAGRYLTPHNQRTSEFSTMRVTSMHLHDQHQPSTRAPASAENPSVSSVFTAMQQLSLAAVVDRTRAAEAVALVDVGGRPFGR